MHFLLPLALSLLPAAPQTGDLAPLGEVDPFCLDTAGESNDISFAAEYTERVLGDGRLELELCVCIEGTPPESRLHLSRNGTKFYLFYTDVLGSAFFCIRKIVDAGPDGRPAGLKRFDDGDVLRLFSRPGEGVDVEGTFGPSIAPGLINITGKVFYDANEDGVFDAGDDPIEGWRVELDTDGSVEVVFTDENGCYAFGHDLDGITRELRTLSPLTDFIPVPEGRWLATSPNPIEVTTDKCIIENDFGNLFFVSAPELGRSKGYWHNQGREELSICDPAWREALNGLCLRTNFSNPDGEEGTLYIVDETASFDDAFDPLSDYLTAPVRGVLANALSTQVAAAFLNVTCGPLQGLTVYIDQEGDQVLVTFEEMAANTIAMLCNPRSANTGPHGDQEWREMIMGCLDEWEGMNSGTGNANVPREGAPPFGSPY